MHFQSLLLHIVYGGVQSHRNRRDTAVFLAKDMGRPAALQVEVLQIVEQLVHIQGRGHHDFLLPDFPRQPRLLLSCN